MTYQSIDESATRRRMLLAVFAALFVAGVVAIYFATRPKPTVEQQIARAFHESQEAAQNGDIAGATAILSDGFRAGDLNKQRIKLILFQARRQAVDVNWSVEVTPPQVLPAVGNAPDKRLVVTRIVARDAATGNPIWSSGDSPITLQMRDEPTRVWGIFPSHAWRIISAPSLPSL